MDPQRLAAWLDSYRASLKSAIRQAACDRYPALCPNAAGPDLDPRNLTRTARRHLARYVRDLGTRLASIALEYPGAGLADLRHADERLDRLSGTLDLCTDLGVPRAAVTLGGFHDPRTVDLARELTPLLADLAHRRGIELSLYTGGAESPEKLIEAVRAARCPWLRAGLDTVQLASSSILLDAAVGVLGSVRARDVRHVGDRLEEVEFGQGEVDFPALLAELESGDFSSLLIIRRDAPGAGVAALRRGREYIDALLRRGAIG